MKTDVESDVLILDSIELLPAFRKRAITPRTIKDFFNNFGSGTAYYLASMIPNQQGSLGDNEWNERLKYSSFEADVDKASFPLYAILPIVNK